MQPSSKFAWVGQRASLIQASKQVALAGGIFWGRLPVIPNRQTQGNQETAQTIRLLHSSRNAIIGSIRAARLAGIQLATAAAAISTANEPAAVSGSVVLKSERILERHLVQLELRLHVDSL